MHQILPTALLDRLIYHNIRSRRTRNGPEGDNGVTSSPALPLEEILERVQSLQYMYFAAGIASVWQVISVSVVSSVILEITNAPL